MKQFLLLTLTLILTTPIVTAQTPPQYMYNLPEQFINNRILELSQITEISNNETLLLREMDKLDGEVAQAQQVIINIPEWNSIENRAQKKKTNIISAIENIKSTDCKKDIQKFAEIKHVFSDAYFFIEGYRRSSYPDIDISQLEKIYPASVDKSSDQDACNTIKNAVLDKNTAESALSTFDFLINTLEKNSQTMSTYKSLVEKYLDALQKRRLIIQNKIGTQSTKQQISSYLWIIMIVIGASGVLTMLVIRIFPENLQMEWIASGQVIQFVTVLVLLSVIMALGLSGILNENTLGTLLGGIAGYVLAQGVGRAAAREASTRTIDRIDKNS